MQRPTSFPRALLTLCLVIVVAMVAEWTAMAETGEPRRLSSSARSQTADAFPPVPRPTYLYAGACDDLGDIQWPLNDLMSPNGKDGGADDADRTEYSFTANIPLTIDLMLAGEYAINVHEGDENIGNSIACGDIGGVADSVGTLVIGLREQGGSDVTGIVVLSPSPANPAMSFASVFITGSGLGDAIGTIGSEPAGDADPPVTDSPPVDNAPPVDLPPNSDDDDDDDDGGDDDGGDD